MSKPCFMLAATAAALVIAPPASAGVIPNPGQFFHLAGQTGVFGRLDITCPAGTEPPCYFSDDFAFDNPPGYDLLSVSITSISSSADTAVVFDEVTYDFMHPFEIENGPNYAHAVKLNYMAGAWDGFNILTVSGFSGGHGSYSGVLAYTWSGINHGVPEPGTWMMMVLGIGAIGIALRRKARNKQPALSVLPSI